MSGQLLDFNSARPQGEQPKTITADAVRDAVTARAREFIEWMFPCAVVHRSGTYAVIGNIYGQPGESLNIQLTGAKAGFWKDWAGSSDQGKDLIGLFLATNDMSRTDDFPKALEIINREFLGSAAPEWTRQFTVQFKERAKEHADKPRPQINDRPPPTETYIYRDFDGGIIGLTRRHEFDEIDPETGKKRKTFSAWDARSSKPQAPMPRPLYRIPEISRVNELVFVEGEKKADALASIGIEATCIMFGANAPLEKVDWTVISGKNITIWPDKDKSGAGFAEKLAPVLSALGCTVLVVIPPDDKPNKWDAADCIAEGGDAIAILQDAKAYSGQAQPAGLFKLYTLEELEHLPPPEWLIKGMITEGGLSLFWSGSDSYKTFVAIDIAMCIATGSPWHGREVRAGHVVYVAAEDEGGVKLRMIGWRDTRGKALPRANLTIMRDGISLATADGDKLVNSILAHPEKPKLIIIDTLQRTFGVGNENQTQDMNAYVLAADRLRRATGANVMIIHHSGRNVEQERGNLALRGACDTIITVKRTNDKIKLINKPPKGKQKNSEPFEDINLRMQKTFFDYNGTEQSTLLVMSDDGAPAAGEPLEDDEFEDAAPRLGQIEKSILSALDKAARSERKYLGFISLHAMVGGDRGSFGRSLRKLVTKDIVEEFLDETDPEKSRKNYARLK